MDRSHVWVSRLSYEFYLRLARRLDARLIIAGSAARPLSFREVAELVLAYHGHLPGPTDPRLQLALKELPNILLPGEPTDREARAEA